MTEARVPMPGRAGGRMRLTRREKSTAKAHLKRPRVKSCAQSRAEEGGPSRQARGRVRPDDSPPTSQRSPEAHRRLAGTACRKSRWASEGASCAGDSAPAGRVQGTPPERAHLLWEYTPVLGEHERIQVLEPAQSPASKGHRAGTRSLRTEPSCPEEDACVPFCRCTIVTGSRMTPFALSLAEHALRTTHSGEAATSPAPQVYGFGFRV